MVVPEKKGKIIFSCNMYLFANMGKMTYFGIEPERKENGNVLKQRTSMTNSKHNSVVIL